MIQYLLASILLTVSCYADEMQSICSSNDCYTIVKELGEGAFGTVYEVKNKEDIPFALKSYKPTEDISAWWDALGDVEREFQRGQELDHPHIIRSIELFSQVEDNYLVLQFVKGDALYKVEKQSISFDKTIVGALQLIEALRYGVTLDLYHLDLHGGNVMMTDESEVMVVDLASFFSFDEITGVYKKAKRVVQPKKLKAFFEKNPGLHEKLKVRKGLSTNNEPFRKSFSQIYFDKITDMCVRIIKKSDLDRDEKIEIQAEIKKLSWNYRDDLEEGLETDLDEYLDMLINTLIHL